MRINILGNAVAAMLSCVLLSCRHTPIEKPLESYSVLSYKKDSLKKEYHGELREYNGIRLSSIADFVENSIRGPQQVPEETYRLKIAGLVKANVELTYDQVLEHFHYTKVEKLQCVDGWQVTILWEGVRIEDLLNQAGIKDNNVSVIFTAVDGYSIKLPLEYILSKHLLLAYKMNGLKLPAERGFPFVVVAESKEGFNWVKWVTRIEVVYN